MRTIYIKYEIRSIDREINNEDRERRQDKRSVLR